VATFGEHLSDFYRAARAKPDDLMLEIGAGGESLVAYTRVVIVLLLLLLPLASTLFSDAKFESSAGAIGVLIALLVSLYWLKLTKREPRPTWLSFATTASDITSVTLVLALLAMVNPSAGGNSVVTWLCYPLCIMTTALRNDIRVTWFAGGLAIVQFSLLLLYLFSLPENALYSSEYGTVETANSVQRLILLVIFTLSTALIVYRMQRLVKISGTDNLTGLHNRMYLNEHVPRLIETAEKTNSPLSLAIIDLDFFKAINDQHGHHVGDMALKHAVSVIRGRLQKGESLLRIGGEEFLYVAKLPPEAALANLETLRTTLADSHFRMDDGASKQITFSAGVAAFPRHANSLSLLLKTADAHLRMAKQGGRNRIVCEGLPARPAL